MTCNREDVAKEPAGSGENFIRTGCLREVQEGSAFTLRALPRFVEAGSLISFFFFLPTQK